MTLTKRETILAVETGGCLLVLIAVLMASVLPSMRSRSNEIDELESKIEAGHELIKRKDDLQKTWGEYQEAARALSSDQSQAENTVVQFFHEKARRRGVELTDLRPNWRKQKDSDYALELRTSGEGEIEEIAGFLMDVETDTLPFRVESFEVTSPKGDMKRLRLQLAVSVVLMPESFSGRRSSR